MCDNNKNKLKSQGECESQGFSFNPGEDFDGVGSGFSLPGGFEGYPDFYTLLSHIEGVNVEVKPVFSPGGVEREFSIKFEKEKLPEIMEKLRDVEGCEGLLLILSEISRHRKGENCERE